MATTKTVNGVALKTSGLNIAKAVYNDASSAFRADVPAPTPDNAQDFFASVFKFQPTANEFAAALVNKIAFPWIRRARAYDPLTANFVKGEISPGFSIEEIFADLLPVYDMDWCDDYIGEQFRRETPRLYTLYHEINFGKKVRSTVNDQLLSRAFRSWDELANLTAIVTSQLYESMRDAEYQASKRLVDLAYAGGMMYPVPVTPIDNNSTAANIEAVSVAMREAYLRMQFASRKYNYMGANNRVDADEIYIICTPTFRANMDIKSLANAFNVEYAKLYGHVIVIDDFGFPACQAIMCSRDWFQIWQSSERTSSLYNPENNNINYTLIKSASFDVSLFAPCVVFVDASALNTVASVAVTADQSAAKCAMTKIEATVTGGDVANGYLYNKLSFAVSGNTSKRTVMYPFGMLYVAPDEEASTLTVTVTSGQDETKTATGTVTVTG